jgi:hypothetical protein
MDLVRIASKVAQGWQDELQGGLADDKMPQQFDPQSLIKGTVVEFEHTCAEAHELLKQNPDAVHKAIEIAMDHLTEDPAYYDKLAEMESSGRQQTASRATEHLMYWKQALSGDAPRDPGSKATARKYADLADMLANKKERKVSQGLPHPRFESFYVKWSPDELRELARGLRMLSA